MKDGLLTSRKTETKCRRPPSFIFKVNCLLSNKKTPEGVSFLLTFGIGLGKSRAELCVVVNEGDIGFQAAAACHFKYSLK